MNRKNSRLFVVASLAGLVLSGRRLFLRSPGIQQTFIFMLNAQA